MRSKVVENSYWKLDGTVGRLLSGELTGAVDAFRPNRGIADIALSGQPIRGHFLGVHWKDPSAMCSADADFEEQDSWPTKLAESYVRSGDLVARYHPAPEYPYALHIYWRVDVLPLANGVLGSLSVVVSVQTELLDTHPRICIHSQLEAQEALHIVVDESGRASNQFLDTAIPAQEFEPRGMATCLLWRPPRSETSYAEIALASDFRQVGVSQNARDRRAEWDLFADFLEKGVIRRARLHALFLPREGDVELAAECCRSLERRPLPLTT